MVTRRSIRKATVFVLLNLACFCFFIAQASAISMSTIELSDVSSDETPASVLDARFTFTVTDSTLELMVENLTADPTAYKLNEIYFNAVDGVSLRLSESLPLPGEWELSFYDKADGFGYFDYALTTKQNDSPILAGNNETFSFFISGTDDAADFTTDGSWDHPHIAKASQTAYLAAAKFVSGPNDDSAFGTAVPEPATILLLGSGLVGFVGLGRRRLSRA